MKEKSTFLKWTALFVLVFTLSLPLTAKESFAGTMYTVSVSKGYLALRTAKAYDDKNEIGELYTGDTVEVTDTSDSTYWYVYSAKLNKSGYVNRNYLVGGGSSTGGSNYTVSVSKGYLALRTARHTMIRMKSESFTAEILYRYRIPATAPTGTYIPRSLTNPAM